MALGICEGCRRFARGETCPFCGANVGAPPTKKPGRRARNGVLAAAAITIACGGMTTGPGSDASDDRTTTPDAPADAPEDHCCPLPPYGIAPMDAGKSSDGSSD